MAGTVIAVTVSIAAINLAGSGVADSSSVTLSHTKVAAALGTSHESTHGSAATSTTAKRYGTSPTTTSPLPGGSGATGATTSASPGASPPAAGGSTEHETSTTEPTGGSGTKTTVAPTTSTTTTPSSSASKTSPGGSVQVQCIGNDITLVSAVPSAGYELDDSPRVTASTVHVAFDSKVGDNSSEIGATCADGVITFTVDD